MMRSSELARRLQEIGNRFQTMKKRTQNPQIETHPHPNLVNYLALIHAVTHPGSRPEPSRVNRSAKSVHAPAMVH